VFHPIRANPYHLRAIQSVQIRKIRIIRVLSNQQKSTLYLLDA